MSKFYNDRWRIMRYLLVGPITFIIYALFAFGFWIFCKVEDTWFDPVWSIVYGLPFLILDILYNVLIGSFIWWEFPKELLYTDRIKRWDDRSEFAKVMGEYMNIWDPGHV